MSSTEITDVHKWTRDQFLITTDPNLLDPRAINNAFGTEAVSWAKPLPWDILQLMLEKSVNFGVYDIAKSANPDDSKSKPKQIGLARLVTDYTTLAYLTDVYVEPEYQGKGLGNWLIECVRDWTEEIPHLRRVVLVASEAVGEKYYAKVLGTGRPEDEGTEHRIISTRGPALRDWKGH